MELQIAIQRATQILYEERIRPTVRYADAAFAYLEDSRKLNADVQSGVITRAESIAITTGRPRRLNIVGMRNQDPRTVSESQHGFTFSSLNYDLLLKLFNLVNQSERDVFVASLVSVIPTQGEFCARADEYAFPSLDGFVCEFPLIAEFAIRAGYSKDLFTAMNKATVPTYGMAVLLIHLEDMLSLNFTLFSESELERMALWLSPLRNMADLQTYSARGKHGIGGMAPNPLYKAGREKQGSQIVKSIDSMYGLISQALFFYLKGALQQSPNLEVEDDKAKVEGFLESLGFDAMLIASLKKSEDLYRATDQFDLKSCLGHLRSFYEHLHIQAANVLAAQAGGTLTNEFDQAMSLLRNKSLLNPQQEKFARGLYTLISNEGVHALIAEREFARLLRNMVIEYGLLFLTMLEKKGVTLQASNSQTATGMQPGSAPNSIPPASTPL